MRINIKGNDVTPEKIAEALASCEREYGLRIRGATIYVRWENEMGQNVKPLMNGEEFSRSFAFWKQKEKVTRPTPPTPETHAKTSAPISVKDMIELCKGKARRSLSDGEMKTLIELAKTTGVDHETFQRCLELTVAKTGRFNVVYLNSLVIDRFKSMKNELTDYR